MIKINLLPARKDVFKTAIRKEYLVLGGSLALLVAILVGIQWKIDGEIKETAAQISAAQKDILRHKNLVSGLNQAKEAQKSLQDKLNVIDALRKEKASAAMVLDELSTDKPEKLHLDSLKKEGAKLGIEGVALDDETVANFMTNLRKSKIFKNVDLVVTQQIEQNKIKLKKFVLQCEIRL
jgi:type IV pilus assembly protein PilN